MRQFYLPTDPDHAPAAGDRLLLDADESHHLATVLRGGRDTELHLVDGRGLRLKARATGAEGRCQQVEILTVERDESEIAPPRLVLGCAVVKGKRFEWALEKAVELGVHRIIPLHTERGEIRPRQGKQDRWRTILVAALKQSGRSWLPDLAEPAAPAAAFAAATGPVLFGAVPGEVPEVRPWSALLNEAPAESPAEMTVLVGPEGGWTPAERALLLECGAIPVDLGPHVLRTETAAAAGVFALQSIRRAWRAVGA